MDQDKCPEHWHCEWAWVNRCPCINHPDWEATMADARLGRMVIEAISRLRGEEDTNSIHSVNRAILHVLEDMAKDAEVKV